MPSSTDLVDEIVRLRTDVSHLHKQIDVLKGMLLAAGVPRSLINTAMMEAGQ